MPQRFLYCYRPAGNPHDVQNLLPAVTSWTDGGSPPASVTGTDRITLVIRSHGGRGGTVNHQNAAVYARGVYNSLSQSLQSRVNQVVILACWAGQGVTTSAANTFPTGVAVWGPNSVLANSGSTMNVRGAAAGVAIRAGITDPRRELTAARGFSGRVY